MQSDDPNIQPELKEGDGPVGLVCAPTRELCQQIYHEARKFSKVYGLRVSATVFKCEINMLGVRCVQCMVDQANGSKHKISNKEQKLLSQLLLVLNVLISSVAMALIKGSFD